MVHRAFKMALFEFEFKNVDDIVPWQSDEGPYFSWFALTDGSFWMPVGDQVLFEYSDEIMAHWGIGDRRVDYQIAALARDVLGSMTAGLARLPEPIERLASNWELLTDLYARSAAVGGATGDSDLWDTAWRWLGERRPWASYFVAEPHFYFVRIGDSVRVHWDNRDRIVDGHSVWRATTGGFELSAESFLAECNDFAARLLGAMERRIEDIEAGRCKAQEPLDPRSLREQHEEWERELAGYFREHEPDFAWDDVSGALNVLATRCGLRF